MPPQSKEPKASRAPADALTLEQAQDTMSTKIARTASSQPSTQSTLPKPPKPLGGVFSPAAQYPGANYATVLSTSKDAPYEPTAPAVKSKELVKHVVRAKSSAAKALPHGYTQALLLVEIESHARVDKNALRGAGIDHVQVLTSGMLAARFLAMQAEKHDSDKHDATGIDCIFCTARLADMSALQWMDLVRQHPHMARIPMMLISGNTQEAEILSTIEDGFDGLLMRPYSQDDVRRLLGHVYDTFRPREVPYVEQSQADFAATLKLLESYQGEEAKGEMNFRDGLRHIKEKSWDAAIQALTKALYHKDVKGEAEYGLAAAWQGKKNIEKQRYYLSEACTTFVRTQKWARARLAYTQLLRVLPTAENPFIRLAESHIRSQEFKEAAGTLALGLDLGNGDSAVTRLAKACLFTENPPFTLKQIEKTFTAQELQGLVQALPAEMQRLSDAHEASTQQYREDVEQLKAQAKAMPIQDSILALHQQRQQGQGQKGAYDPASYRGHEGDVSGVIPGMPSLINAKRSTDGVESMSGGVLEPLDEEDMGVELFSAFPRLNEMATVVKVTWNLMKRKG